MSADPIPISEPFVLAIVATVLNGLFACADTALTSTTSERLGALATKSSRHHGAIERVLQHRPVVQSRFVVGRVISTATATGAGALWIWSLPVDNVTRTALAFGAVFALTVLVEIATAAARRMTDTLLPWLLVIVRPFELVLAPIAFVTSAFDGLFKRQRENDPKVAEREMELVVDQRERSGALEHHPAELIRNVLEFGEMTARDAMIPRKRVKAIKLGTPLEEVLELVTQSGHSRYPVYETDVDDVSGLLCAKDLFRVLQAPGEAPVSGPRPQLYEIVREPVKYIAESQPLSTLLHEMRQERQHLAIVVDEYGGTSGIVTLEDVLEEIVGDIRDEYDPEEVPIVELGHGRLIADAAVLVSELSAYLGSDLDPDAQYDSLGGMLTDMLGSVPEVGTSLSAQGMDFIVRESDEKHIAKVEIVRALADTSGPHSAAS